MRKNQRKYNSYCKVIYTDKEDKQYQYSKDFPRQFYERKTSEETKKLLCKAITRAKSRDENKCKDSPFYSDVYRLVEKIISKPE